MGQDEKEMMRLASLLEKDPPKKEAKGGETAEAMVAGFGLGLLFGVGALLAAGASEPKGADHSRQVRLWEAYWKGAPWRLAVVLGEGEGKERAYLTLQGARHLRKRLDSTIKRLAKKRAR